MTRAKPTQAKIRVAEIIEKWDMRSVHKLRNHNKSKSLNALSCVVAFNKAQSIARIIDWKGGVHTYYAAKDQVFDLVTLRELVKVAFYVDLEPGANAKRRASELMIAA